MRIAGIVLLVLAASVVVPSLTFAGWVQLGYGSDPYLLKTYAALATAALGICVGAIGGAAAFVSRKE